jgi:RNA polymerase sigma-70 factor (ECF subfamily)
MLAVSEARPVQTESGAAGDLVGRLIALDAAAWQELFEQYHRKMYSFAYVRTGDLNAAEEIASEVFAAAVAGIGRYRPTGAPFAAWLYRIARNITADHLDRRRRRPTASLEGVEIEVSGPALQVERQADLARGIAALTREQQEVISLRYMSDCSLEEAAQAMGKSVGAVKLLQHRAIIALRKQMTRGER